MRHMKHATVHEVHLTGELGSFFAPCVPGRSEVFVLNVERAPIENPKLPDDLEPTNGVRNGDPVGFAPCEVLGSGAVGHLRVEIYEAIPSLLDLLLGPMLQAPKPQDLLIPG